MSKSERTDSADNESADSDEHSMEWLEQLAGEPDAIWETVPSAIDPAEEMGPAEAKESRREIDREDTEPVVEPVNVEQVAQGVPEPEPVEERLPLARETFDYGDELNLEADDLMWLDEMDMVPEMNMNPHDNDENRLVDEVDSSATGDQQEEVHAEATVDSSLDANLDQVPEDPDEAVAWLERLAAKQGAPAEELPTVESIVPLAGVPLGDEDFATISEMDAGEIPEDPDEAMAWLERLAAQEVAQVDEIPTLPESEEHETVTEQEPDPEPIEKMQDRSLPNDLEDALDDSLPDDLDEALGWLEELTLQPEFAEESDLPAESLQAVEEPPTPAVAHQVDEAMAGAELLFAEPQVIDDDEDLVPSEDDLPPDEGDDAMAWLEQLAARQGAPIEELTTVEESVGIEVEDDVAAPELAAPDMPVDDVAAREMAEIAAAGVASAADLQDAADVDAPVEMEHAVVEPAEAVPDELPQDSGTEAVIDDGLEIIEQPVEQIAEMDAVASVAAGEGEPSTAAGIEEMHAVEDLADQELLESEFAAMDEMEVSEAEGAAPEDLAWLDSLGAVDAESWLESEAVVEPAEVARPSQELLEAEQPQADEFTFLEQPALVGLLPEGPGSENLSQARRSMDAGEFSESLTMYSELVEEGELLPFLIDDLEAVSERQGPKPELQRVLGDAYARNGQLQKALSTYRAALAEL